MSAGNFLTSSLPPTLSPAFAPGVFSPVQSQSFAARLTGGADAFKPSRDGATAMSPPAAQGFRQPQSDRSALLAATAGWRGGREEAAPSRRACVSRMARAGETPVARGWKLP